MFTLQQIKDAHSKVKSGADFPQYIQDIKALGVLSYITFVADGHNLFNGADNFSITSLQRYETFAIASDADILALKNALIIHQQGGTDYMTFCRHCAEAGVEKWVVDISEMTCTYYDKRGVEMVEELIPQP